jgi:hypothetical protein
VVEAYLPGRFALACLSLDKECTVIRLSLPALPP